MSLQLILANAARIPKYRFCFDEKSIRKKTGTTYKKVEYMSWLIPLSSLVCNCVVRIEVDRKRGERLNVPRSTSADKINQYIKICSRSFNSLLCLRLSLSRLSVEGNDRYDYTLRDLQVS